MKHLSPAGEMFYRLPTADIRFPFLIFRQMFSKDVCCIGRGFLGKMVQMHVDFIHPAPTFAMIAAWARRYNIRPGMLPAQVSGNDMVHGQTTVAPATILAGIIIAAKNFSTGQLYVGTRSMNLGLEPNDGRPGQQLL